MMTTMTMHDMPFTATDQFTPEQLAEWLMSRKAAGVTIDDLETCEFLCCFADANDPYGLLTDLTDQQRDFVVAFVRTAETNGWVYQFDLPAERLDAISERSERWRLLERVAVAAHPSWTHTPQGGWEWKGDGPRPTMAELIEWFRTNHPGLAADAERKIKADVAAACERAAKAAENVPVHTRIIDAAKLLVSMSQMKGEELEQAGLAFRAAVASLDESGAMRAIGMASKLLEGEAYSITTDDPDNLRLYMAVAHKLDARIEPCEGPPLFEGEALPPDARSFMICPAAMLRNAFHQPGGIAHPPDDLLTNPVSERTNRHFQRWVWTKALNHAKAVEDMSDKERDRYMDSVVYSADVVFAVHQVNDGFGLYLVKGTAALQAASSTGTFSFSIDAVGVALSLAMQLRRACDNGVYSKPLEKPGASRARQEDAP
jgi:hypothetical protein